MYDLIQSIQEKNLVVSKNFLIFAVEIQSYIIIL
nr:MAG TPA: hypothetical protein [Caudoviricetes sp.]